MEASVTSPSGVTQRCDILDLEEGHYSIKFVPKEMGIHTVSVKHKGMHIPGMIVLIWKKKPLYFNVRWKVI